MYLKIQTKTNCFLDANLQIIAKVFVHDIRKIFNLKTRHKLLVIFEKGTVTWYGEQKTWDAITHECLAVVVKNPKIAEQCKDNFFKGAKLFLNFLRNLNATPLEKLCNKELWEVFDQYCQQYRKLCVYGEPLAHYVRETLTEEIQKRAVCTDEQLNLLLTPNYISFIKREEIDLLKIAVETKNKKSEEEKRLEEHTQQYFWIPFDYGVMIWNKEHFKKQFQKIKNPEQELQKIQEYVDNIAIKQKQLEQKLKIDAETKKLIEAQRIFAIIMDYKKEIFTQAHVAFIPFTKELMRRLTLSEEQAKMMPIEQIKQGLLENKQPDKAWLDEIITFSIGKLDDQGSYHFIAGKEAKQIQRELSKESFENKNITELQGYNACKGYYKGNVRVITDAKMINELKQGEVLVCHMTSPDFVIGMKKAGAIITDEGGITSHAAIVSRELGIPCLISTKHATKILKTGDNVEVDANQGIIRLVK